MKILICKILVYFRPLPFGQWVRCHWVGLTPLDAVLFSILILIGSVQAQIPLLVKDINVQPDPLLTTTTLGSDPRFLTNHNGVLYFTAKQNGTTTSLWKTSGRLANTIKIMDLPGTAYGLTSVGNLLYFVADTPNFGLEVWKSDGTASGTQQVKDIYTGSTGSMPSGLTNVNGTLYFVATDATAGSELWKSNGTEAGTVLVKDMVVGKVGSDPQSLVNVNGTLYFVADDGVSGYELWKTNGTAAGTTLVKNINAGQANGSPQSLTNVNGVLYFTANNTTNGHELWKSDGTTNGTVLVKDIWSGSANGMPHLLTNSDGTLYFVANDGLKGDELWKSNGTSVGTTIVKDILLGSKGSDPRHLKNIKGSLYFSATNGDTGQEVWKSDGTEAGTVMVKNINLGGQSANPWAFTELKNQVYFIATDGTSGREWWKSDGKEIGTETVFDLNKGEHGGSINNIITLADTLYFTADDGKKGSEIWKIESCLPLKLMSNDTTICHKGPISLPQIVTNYSSFANQVWRKDGFDGPIVANPTTVTLDSAKTDFYLVAQLGNGGCISTAHVTIRTIPLPESVGGIRVLLEGPYQNGTGNMSTKLNQNGLLPGQTPTNALGLKTPTKQPYSGSPWYYNGDEVVGNYEANITDWVLVSLRTDPLDPTTTVFKAAALIQNDGLISSVKGCPGKLKDHTNYYVAVEHRNHLSVVSAVPALFINGRFFHDFTITQSYLPANTPAIGQKQADSRFMMYAGDFYKSTNSNEINASDISAWQRENGLFSRYLSGDSNLDGEVNALDKILWRINNGLFSGVKF